MEDSEVIRDKIAELAHEISEAEKAGDWEKVAKLIAQMQALVDAWVDEALKERGR